MEDVESAQLAAFVHAMPWDVPVGFAIGVAGQDDNLEILTGISVRLGRLARHNAYFVIGSHLGKVSTLPAGEALGAAPINQSAFSNLPTRNDRDTFLALTFSFLGNAQDALRSSRDGLPRPGDDVEHELVRSGGELREGTADVGFSRTPHLERPAARAACTFLERGTGARDDVRLARARVDMLEAHELDLEPDGLDVHVRRCRLLEAIGEPFRKELGHARDPDVARIGQERGRLCVEPPIENVRPFEPARRRYSIQAYRRR